MTGDADFSAAAGRVADIGYALAGFTAVAGLLARTLANAATAVAITAELSAAVRFAAGIVIDIIIVVVLAEMSHRTTGFGVLTGA